MSFEIGHQMTAQAIQNTTKNNIKFEKIRFQIREKNIGKVLFGPINYYSLQASIIFPTGQRLGLLGGSKVGIAR